MQAQERLLPWLDALREQVPGLELYDAHVHVGLHDPAGLLATADEALEAVRGVQARALVFPLKEPEGYRKANRTVVELAAQHPDVFRALARLDPHDDPLGEAQRWVAEGAVGLKLHPRGEGFELADRELDDVFAFAGERRLPIMIHAGVGTPEAGDQVLRRAEEHPDARFIMAHCAVGAFESIVPRVTEVPNVFFDTSWWNPADVYALFRLVPPGRILFASDIPFASPAEGALLTGRMAIQAGLDHDQLRGVMGGQLARLVAHDEPLDLGPVPEAPPALPPDLERVYVSLCITVEPLMRGEPPGQNLELARVACRQRSGHEELLQSVSALLDLFEEEQTPDPLRSERTPGYDLVLIGAVVARTPRAAVPSPVPASSG